MFASRCLQSLRTFAGSRKKGLRKNANLHKLIIRAMGVLETMSCGGVGGDGPTITELESVWENGEVFEDNADYDVVQHAWRLLESALKEVTQ